MEHRHPITPPRRIALALLYGALCHGLFAIAILSMVVMMATGMSWSFGTIEAPWSWITNLLLIAQFCFSHSILLSKPGRAFLQRLAPAAVARDMAPTTYVIISSVSLIALFTGWSFSGEVWFQPSGPLLILWSLVYLGAFGLLGLSILNSGIALQSGFNGWWAVLLGRAAKYPDMPTSWLFAVIRQPIYVSFALTTWATPTWSPDQLMLAISLTAYCLIGPLFKEARFKTLYGDRFKAYTEQVPYWFPYPRPRR